MYTYEKGKIMWITYDSVVLDSDRRYYLEKDLLRTSCPKSWYILRKFLIELIGRKAILKLNVGGFIVDVGRYRITKTGTLIAYI